jgi:hypothetical protein
MRYDKTVQQGWHHVECRAGNKDDNVRFAFPHPTRDETCALTFIFEIDDLTRLRDEISGVLIELEAAKLARQLTGRES